MMASKSDTHKSASHETSQTAIHSSSGKALRRTAQLPVRLIAIIVRSRSCAAQRAYRPHPVTIHLALGMHRNKSAALVLLFRLGGALVALPPDLPATANLSAR